MFDFKFLKDRYDFELTRKEQITNALTMPIGAMSVVGGRPSIEDEMRFIMPTQQAPEPTATQPVPAPQKPTFPQNRVVKEGGMGSKVKK